MSLSVIPLTILGQITGVSGSGDTVLYQVSFKSIDGTPLYGVAAVWTDEQAEIEALAAQKPYGVWINPIDGTFTVKFAGYTYVGNADLTDQDVLAGITPIEFTSAEVSDRLLPEVDAEDAGKTVIVNENGKWELGSFTDDVYDCDVNFPSLATALSSNFMQLTQVNFGQEVEITNDLVASECAAFIAAIKSGIRRVKLSLIIPLLSVNYTTISDVFCVTTNNITSPITSATFALSTPDPNSTYAQINIVIMSDDGGTSYDGLLLACNNFSS